MIEPSVGSVRHRRRRSGIPKLKARDFEDRLGLCVHAVQSFARCMDARSARKQRGGPRSPLLLLFFMTSNNNKGNQPFLAGSNVNFSQSAWTAWTGWTELDWCAGLTATELGRQRHRPRQWANQRFDRATPRTLASPAQGEESSSNKAVATCRLPLSRKAGFFVPPVR